MNTPCRVMADLNAHMHMLERRESREASLRREHPLSDFREQAIQAMHDEVGYEFLLTLIESRAPAVLSVLLSVTDGGSQDRTGLTQENARHGLAEAREAWLLDRQHQLRDNFIGRELSA